MGEDLRFERVSPEEIRGIFNAAGLEKDVEQGKLNELLVEDGHPSPRRSGEPFCTRSQILVYMDPDGREIARVHRYLRPDDSIGASGRPDPKAVRVQDTV
jgi:hypothetical protein